MPIIDAHVHYSLPVTSDQIQTMLKRTKTDIVNLVACFSKTKGSENPDCLLAKYLVPSKTYVFGSLDLTVYFKHPNEVGKYQVKYVKELLKCGCDGIKMLEGKPTTRNRYPIPDFDLPTWDLYWQYLEKNQIPVVWHVNDPEEFWDINKVPSWAKASGWYYDEKTINNETQYEQIYRVLKRYPHLKIIFAHFYFMSAQLPRLAKLFEEFPNISVDITPGIEMFTNFSKNQVSAKAFFEKYQDRIIYGTDISSDGDCHDGFDQNDSFIRADLCRSYLAKDQDILMKGDPNSLLGADDFVLKPLGLNENIQAKILGQNFLRLTSNKSNPVNILEVLKECGRVKRQIKYLAKHFNIEPDYQTINYFISYFKQEITR